jgi:hypothetical protein
LCPCVSAGCSDGDAGGAQCGEDGAGVQAVEAAEAGGAGALVVELGAFGDVEGGVGAACLLPASVMACAHAACVVALLAAWDAAGAWGGWGAGVDLAGAPPA